MDIYFDKDCQFFDYIPFVHKNGKIKIPKKYIELFIDDNIFQDINNIPFSIYNQERLRIMYIFSFHMNYWYQDCIYTPKSKFYNLDNLNNADIKNNIEIDIKNGYTFIRLTSLSPKYIKPITNFQEILNILDCERCNKSIELAKIYKLDKPQLVLRKWSKTIETGYEFRCFIYNRKITAICQNDYKICNLEKIEIINRVVDLMNNILYLIPFDDVIMDVSLGTSSNEYDQLIEFNSFGAWANSSSGLYHWIEDYYILHRNPKTILDIDIRFNYFSDNNISKHDLIK